MPRVKKHVRACSSTSRCFTTGSGGTRRWATRVRRRSRRRRDAPSDLTKKGNVRSYHRLRQPSVATWGERPTTGSDEGNSSKGIACPEQPITCAHENWGSLHSGGSGASATRSAPATRPRLLKVRTRKIGTPTY